MLEPSKEIIQRFFDGTCSVEEVSLVKKYFANHPEALASYMNEENWLLFLEEYEQEVADAQRIFINHPVNKRNYFNRLSRVSVAAGILMLLALGIWKIGFDEDHQVVADTNRDGAGKTTIILAKKIIIENTTNEEQVYLLPDSSVVNLYANSSIRYEHPFPVDSRPVILKGKAMFDVSKDTEKAFTVYAGNISTTALGTRFLVDEEFSGVNVKLYSGKVAVRNVLDSNDSHMVFLMPMQEFSYRLSTGKVSKKTFKSVLQQVEKKTSPVTEQHLSELIFNQTPLKTVLDQLKKKEKIDIIYHNELFPQNMTYTGRFDSRKESVYEFLQLLAKLNGFQIDKTDNGYYITQP
ncbi:FecR family protein [Gynurincola endophyticus]|uniref:FecR family protein n=1 Tax=Gynurincola endophyticus TaxID=2479004 RepID=UPI000F8D59E7|nr:FecR family protein [Gynurincola endophyticus]